MKCISLSSDTVSRITGEERAEFSRLGLNKKERAIRVDEEKGDFQKPEVE